MEPAHRGEPREHLGRGRRRERGGLGNPVIATGELGGSLLLSVLAFAAPVFALGIVLVLVLLAVKLLRRLLLRR